jgi:hypothetical protein
VPAQSLEIDIETERPVAVAAGLPWRYWLLLEQGLRSFSSELSAPVSALGK